jgi:hypothetical protein
LRKTGDWLLQQAEDGPSEKPATVCHSRQTVERCKDSGRQVGMQRKAAVSRFRGVAAVRAGRLAAGLLLFFNQPDARCADA